MANNNSFRNSLDISEIGGDNNNPQFSTNRGKSKVGKQNKDKKSEKKVHDKNSSDQKETKNLKYFSLDFHSDTNGENWTAKQSNETTYSSFELHNVMKVYCDLEELRETTESNKTCTSVDRYLLKLPKLLSKTDCGKELGIRLPGIGKRYSGAAMSASDSPYYTKINQVLSYVALFREGSLIDGPETKEKTGNAPTGIILYILL